MCVFVCVPAGTRRLESTAAAQRKPHITGCCSKVAFSTCTTAETMSMVRYDRDRDDSHNRGALTATQTNMAENKQGQDYTCGGKKGQKSER